MIRGGIGSASIMLVFVVLCLTIFAIISLVPALTDRDLVNAEVRLVQDFFEADALAEQVLDRILQEHPNNMPENILGIDILSVWDMDLFREVVFFAVPINETQILHVEIGLGHEDGGFPSHQIFAWRMYNLHDWEANEYLELWQGDEFFFQGW